MLTAIVVVADGAGVVALPVLDDDDDDDVVGCGGNCTESKIAASSLRTTDSLRYKPY